MHPSLLALGDQRMTEGQVIGAVSLKLEQQDNVFHGKLWCDHVQVG